MRAWAWCSLLCFPVARNQTKCWAIAIRPFEVVHQAPVGIATNVNAIGNTCEHTFERTVHVFDSFVVIARSNAIFSDDNGHVARLVPCSADACL